MYCESSSYCLNLKSIIANSEIDIDNPNAALLCGQIQNQINDFRSTYSNFVLRSQKPSRTNSFTLTPSRPFLYTLPLRSASRTAYIPPVTPLTNPGN